MWFAPFLQRDHAEVIGALAKAGYDIEEFREWSDTKQAVMAGSILKVETRQAELIAQALGGKG